MSRLRTLIVALAALLAASLSPARADSGTVRINFIKAGWVIGALAVGVAVLGYQLYQERQKPGLSFSIGGKDGLKIEGK